MNLKKIFSLYKKEIIDILRDKKTILMMIIIPLVLYPLLFIFSMYVTTMVITESSHKTYSIGLKDIDNEYELSTFILNNEEKYDYSFIFSTSKDCEKDLMDGKIKAYLAMSVSDNGMTYYDICYDASDNSSSMVSDMLSKLMNDYKNQKRSDTIKSMGVDPDYVLNPFKIQMKNLASNEKTVGNLFGMIIPFLLISTVLMGAMYPAIDVTSGEKERGTLETLLTLPVSNIEMILSKFFATATIATSGAFLNVLSMGILGVYFYSMMGDSSSEYSGFNIALYIPAILLMLLVAVVFALLCSAICLSVCIFARSFKEAQNYTTPVMMIFMFAGMVTMLPNLHLTNKTALIPVVNFALLIADIFKLNYDLSLIAIVILVNLAFTGIAVFFMAKVFSTENILFGDGISGIQIIEKRSFIKAKTTPGIGDMLLLLSVVLIIVIYAGSLLIIKFGPTGMVIQMLLMFSVTLFYAWYIKTDIKNLFSLNMPKIKDIIGGLFSWAGALSIILAGAIIYSYFFPAEVAEVDSGYQYLVGEYPKWLSILAISILPGIVEEFIFRGFIFGSLRSKYSLFIAFFWSSFIFGCFHLSFTRLFYTTLFGFLNAYFLYKSKSIYVSMIMHISNNMFSCIQLMYEKELMKLMPFLYRENLVINELVIMAIVGIVLLLIGLFIVNIKSKDKVKAV